MKIFVIKICDRNCCQRYFSHKCFWQRYFWHKYFLSKKKLSWINSFQLKSFSSKIIFVLIFFIAESKKKYQKFFVIKKIWHEKISCHLYIFHCPLPSAQQISTNRDNEYFLSIIRCFCNFSYCFFFFNFFFKFVIQ